MDYRPFVFSILRTGLDVVPLKIEVILRNFHGDDSQMSTYSLSPSFGVGVAGGQKSTLDGSPIFIVETGSRTFLELSV